jgi:hypothetical protein
MSLGRDDRFVTDALGRALAGAQVYWCQPQPASTVNNPPSPLASIFTDSTGDTPLTQPVLTDGFGHADAYLDGTQPFTIVIWHPLFGSNPLVLPDQFVAQVGGSQTALTPFSGTLQGALNGSNTVFTLTNGGTPIPNITPSPVWVWDNIVLIQGVGYTVSGNQVTFASPPQVGDTLFATGFYA